MFKNNDKLLKKNYRPVSVLTTLSKIFEQLLTSQLNDFFENVFDNMLSAYRKGFSCQNVLTKLLGTWQQGLDNPAMHWVRYDDLSRAFDCMPRSLLISKLSAYGVSKSSCQLLIIYLSNRSQRVKVGNSKSGWEFTTKGFPQGSGFGPLLFNIVSNDLFYIIKTCSLFNYADDNKITVANERPDKVI